MSAPRTTMKDQLAQLYRRFEMICTDPEPEHVLPDELDCGENMIGDTMEMADPEDQELAQKYSEGNKRTSEPRGWIEFMDEKRQKIN